MLVGPGDGEQAVQRAVVDPHRHLLGAGQELVARIDSRGGNVARHLRGLVLARSELHGAGQGLLEGGLLEQGAVALLDGVERATVTSAAYSPTLGAPIALAMVHRSVEPGATLEIDGVSATVVDLPFVSP